MIACCISLSAFAGDTNFVAAFKTTWNTHNASNILVFVEQNVATNRSPETLFARAIVAITLQDWCIGATNYWEQAIQMITTNNTYSVIGKTKSVNSIMALQAIFSEINTNPPTWDTNNHAWVFSQPLDEPALFYMLKDISIIETVEQ